MGIEDGIVTVEKQFGGAWKTWKYHMTWQFHSEVYTQEKWKQRIRYPYADVHSSIIDNTQKMETTQMSINRGMDKQNVA